MGVFGKLGSKTVGAFAHKRMGWLFRAHLYGELWISFLVLAIFTLALLAFWLRPNSDAANRTQDNWTRQPQLVWTPAESDNLAQQLRIDPREPGQQIRIPAAMWGAGPPAVDLSHRNLIEFNAVTAELNRQYRDRLEQGGPFTGSGEDGADPPQYALLNRIVMPSSPEELAYQKALVAFRASRFATSSTDLPVALCDGHTPRGAEGDEDPRARSRSWSIRCNWLLGRLAAEQRKAADATARLRKALAEAETARNERRDSQLISTLVQRDYMVDLPREGSAALWQDYLSALLTFGQGLCDRRCAEPGAVKNLHGKMVDRLTGDQSASAYWRAYPELAVLVRLLRAREGEILAARAIPVNLIDGNGESDGFQVNRFPDDPREFSLAPNYETLAFLSESLIGEKVPSQNELKDAVRDNPAIAFWAAHAASRSRALGHGAEPAKPFADGSNQRAQYDNFQKEWRSDWSGSWWPDDWQEWSLLIALVMFAAWFFGVARPVFVEEGRRRTAEWSAIMGSAYANSRSPADR